MSEAANRPSGDGPDVVRVNARAFERDRYLAALLAPADVRDDLLALAAFAGEIGRIPAYVSEPMIGEIRLQWWRDAVQAALADGAPAAGHPIADALARAIRRHRLPPNLFLRAVDAQSQRLDDAPFADMNALTANLAAWDGTLFEIAWRILGGPGEPPAVLARAGNVYGLSRTLVEAPAELAQGRIVLPLAALAACGLSVETARARESPAQWRMVLAMLAEVTRQRLSDLLPSYQEADAKVRLAALPVALVRPYLRVTERVDFTALEAVDVGPLTRVWRLWRTSRTGRA